MKVKVAGTYRPVDPHLKVSSAFRPIAAKWVKVAGVWRKFYQRSITPPPTGVDKIRFRGIIEVNSYGSFSNVIMADNATDRYSAYGTGQLGELANITSTDINLITVTTGSPSAIPASEYNRFKLHLSTPSGLSLVLTAIPIVGAWESKYNSQSFAWQYPNIYALLAPYVNQVLTVRIYH